MSQELVVSLIVAVFSSTGLFTLIQYLITRKDNRTQKLDEVKETVDGIKDDLLSIHKEIDNLHKASRENFEQVDDMIHQSNAIQARTRILRANDEMRQDVHHSYEYFRQLHQDITDYQNYCSAHPDFKNNEAVNSIEYINKIYLECLEKNDFLV